MADMTRPNGVSWFEINTWESDKAKNFYSKVLNWTTTEMPMEGMDTPYVMWQMFGDQTFGGMMQMTSPEWDGLPPHWMCYFHTPNADETCEKIKANGGDVKYGPFDLPEGMGRIAICADNQGAFFSIYASAQPAEEQDITPVDKRAITWVEHHSPDKSKMVDFYTKVFGWDHTEQDMGGMMYSMFNVDDNWFAGSMVAQEEGIPPNWLMYMLAPDIQVALAKVKEEGGNVISEVMEVPNVGQIAVVSDCCGAVFALHQPAPQC